MKIYVAGKYEEKFKIHSIVEFLRREGYLIPYDWTISETEDLVQNAIKDVDGVVNSDCLVVYAVNDLDYNGTLGEIGAALSQDHPVIIIGSYVSAKKFIFSNHPNVTRFSELSQSLEYLNELRKQFEVNENACYKQGTGISNWGYSSSPGRQFPINNSEVHYTVHYNNCPSKT